MTSPHSLVTIAAAAAVFVSPLVHADQQSRVTLQRYFQNDQLLFCFEVAASRIAGLPAWTEGSGDPPVSRGEAQSIGLHALRAEYPAIERFEVRGIELRDLKLRDGLRRRNIWYYEIEFAAVVGGERKSGSDYITLVLLDGKAVSKERVNCRMPARSRNSPR